MADRASSSDDTASIEKPSGTASSSCSDTAATASGGPATAMGTSRGAISELGHTNAVTRTPMAMDRPSAMPMTLRMVPPTS